MIGNGLSRFCAAYKGKRLSLSVGLPEHQTQQLRFFQKTVDRLSTVTPEDRAGHSLPVNMLQDFGAHVIGSVASPIAHPLDTLKSFARTAGQVLSGPSGQEEAAREMAEPIVRDFAVNGASAAIPHILGDAAGGYLGGELGGSALRGVSRVANKVAPTLAESALSMRGPDRACDIRDLHCISDNAAMSRARVTRLHPALSSGHKTRGIVGFHMTAARAATSKIGLTLPA